MKVKCELLNYKGDKSPFDNPRVVIEDNGALGNQIQIKIIGETWAVVRADELKKAIESCTGLPF